MIILDKLKNILLTIPADQKETFHKLIEGRDCLIVQPTGSGKSLLFQAWPFLNQNDTYIIILL